MTIPLPEATLAAQGRVCLAVADSAFDVPWFLDGGRRQPPSPRALGIEAGSLLASEPAGLLAGSSKRG